MKSVAFPHRVCCPFTIRVISHAEHIHSIPPSLCLIFCFPLLVFICCLLSVCLYPSKSVIPSFLQYPSSWTVALCIFVLSSLSPSLSPFFFFFAAFGIFFSGLRCILKTSSVFSGLTCRLDRYLYDYLVKNNMHRTAETFRKEAALNTDPEVPGGQYFHYKDLLNIRLAVMAAGLCLVNSS